MKVQIYGTRTVEDAVALAEMGLDLLGLEMDAGDDEADRVGEILARVRGRVTVVLLPLFKDLLTIVATCRRLRPDVIHISSNVEELGVEQIGRLRDEAGPIKIMKSIPVAQSGSVQFFDSLEHALAFDSAVDFLLLDTKLGDDSGDPVPGWIGITGQTHDWSVSRTIVERCRTPVILAGGLTPDNVTAAIQAVRPWGVDANTGLNQAPGKKDLARCREFIERARAAGFGL